MWEVQHRYIAGAPPQLVAAEGRLGVSRDVWPLLMRPVRVSHNQGPQSINRKEKCSAASTSSRASKKRHCACLVSRKSSRVEFEER